MSVNKRLQAALDKINAEFIQEAYFRQQRGMAPPMTERPCTGCGCPTINDSHLCHPCEEMWVVVNGRMWFVEAHREYLHEQKRKQAMITGKDYLPGA